MRKSILFVAVIMSLIYVRPVEAKVMIDKKLGPGITMTIIPDKGLHILYLDHSAALKVIETHEGGSRLFGVSSVVSGVLNSYVPLRSMLSGMFSLAAIAESSYASELRSKLSPRGLIIVTDRTGNKVMSR